MSNFLEDLKPAETPAPTSPEVKPDETPTPETPPAPPEPTESEKIQQVLSGIQENISKEIGEIKDKVSQVEEHVKPAEPEPKAWEPQSWEEVDQRAREHAQEEVKRIKAEEDAAIRAQEDQRKSIDKEFDDQLSTLEKAGRIPTIKDNNNPDDPGNIARRELFGLGVKYGSPNLSAMADLAETLHKEGVRYDARQGQMVKDKQPTPGQTAPVGSSSRTTENATKPTYKDIHNLSMDQLVRRYGQ